MNKKFWDSFYQLPLDEIPWQKTQADWFKELVDGGMIRGNSALDLGCGTGMKSIYLAKNGFGEVVGIDIATGAIKYANVNAKKYGVISRVRFVVHDATDLSFLKNKKFDFVLDWANIHGLPKTKRKKYVRQISKHIRKGETYMLIRTFSNKSSGKKYFIDSVGRTSSKIYLLSEKDILSVFGKYFKLIMKNESRPRTKSKLVFEEYLMKAKENF